MLGVLAPQLVAQVYSLEQLKQASLENNRRIREAELNVEASNEIVSNAFTNFFPSVNAQAVTMKATDYLLQMETPEMQLPVYDGDLSTSTDLFTYIPGLSIEALDYMNVGLVTAIQPLYTGGRIRTGYKLAKLGKEINEQALDISTDEVLVTTEVYYWSLLSLQEKQETLARYEKLLISLLNDVQTAFDAGLINQSDVLKVKLNLNEIASNKLKLKNGITLTKMALAQHAGLEYSEKLSISDTSFTTISPFELFFEPQLAVQQRTEIKMFGGVVTAEELKKKMTKGEYLPQVAIGIQGQYLDLEDNPYSLGIAFATVSIPLSDWWGGSHKIQQHNIEIDIAQNNLEETSELIQLQIQKAYTELEESYLQIEVAESAVNQASEYLKVSTDNYDAGIISTSDLLEAQALHQEALDRLVDAQSVYQIKRIQYLQSIAMI